MKFRSARRAATRFVIVSGAAAVSAGFLATAGPANAAVAAPAATGIGYQLNSGNASFKVGGHTWELQLSVLGGKLGKITGLNLVSFSISTSHLGGTEEHSWSDDLVPSKDLSVSSKGGATLKTGSSMNPILSVSLAFSPTSHAKASCDPGGSGTVYSGKLSGTVHFNAGLGGVKVSKKLTFGKPDTLEVSHACTPPTACDLESWIAAGRSTTLLTAGALVGEPPHQKWEVSVERSGVKTSVKGMTRADGGLSVSPAPKFGAGDKSLTVSGSAGGTVTGAAEFTHATLFEHPATFACVFGGKKYTETERNYLGEFTSSKEFEAHTLITGVILAPKTGTGLFSTISMKKK
jgi:hypothetical protein